MCCKALLRTDVEQAVKGAATAAAALLLAGAASAGSLTWDELQGLSYKEVKGSGIANTCPTLGAKAGNELLDMPPGMYQMDKFCMEPTSFQVRPLGFQKFEPTTLLTRNTYTLSEMSGTVQVGRDGSVELQEEDGMDYAAVTVKLRGGTEVPFMFAVKGLHTAGPHDNMAGQFDVNAYRGSTFMDPSGRGGSTGWDYQKGLQAAGSQDDLDRENFKTAAPTTGHALMAVTKADALTGEVEGVFVTRQLASDDMGAHDPDEVQIEGVWYAQLQL